MLAPLFFGIETRPERPRGLEGRYRLVHRDSGNRLILPSRTYRPHRAATATGRSDAVHGNRSPLAQCATELLIRTPGAERQRTQRECSGGDPQNRLRSKPFGSRSQNCASFGAATSRSRHQFPYSEPVRRRGSSHNGTRGRHEGAIHPALFAPPRTAVQPTQIRTSERLLPPPQGVNTPPKDYTIQPCP